MKGVRPEEFELIGEGIGGPGSENRTRFFVLLGVDGGVDMPYCCRAIVDVRKFALNGELPFEEGPALLRRFLRSAIGCSSSCVRIGKCSRSAMVGRDFGGGSQQMRWKTKKWSGQNIDPKTPEVSMQLMKNQENESCRS